MKTPGFAEYLWIDGSVPTQGVRSKARLVNLPAKPSVSDFPVWNFDGLSTGQANGTESDCILTPVRVYNDPFRGHGNYIVLCEVDDTDGSVHDSNHRARMRSIVLQAGMSIDPWLAFHQEYTMIRDGHPLGYAGEGVSIEQGHYYCGAGSEAAFGRDVVEEHVSACIDAGVLIYGMNAAVMPGQWEFQVGYRGIEDEACDALRVADDIWVARYLLNRVGEHHGIRISFNDKPIEGDWIGPAMHANFSTAYTRDPNYGLGAIRAIIDKLKSRHIEHIAQYRCKTEERHIEGNETNTTNDAKSGVADQRRSLRIPQHVAKKGYGYLQDRRPGADSDPYRVGACLIGTVTPDKQLKSRANAA
jgi:glutamine synthetase